MKYKKEGDFTFLNQMVSQYSLKKRRYDSILMEGVCVGEDAVVKNAIIDKDVVIPSGASIGVDIEEDKRKFVVTDSGIVVVPKKQRVKR